MDADSMIGSWCRWMLIGWLVDRCWWTLSKWWTCSRDRMDGWLVDICGWTLVGGQV